MYHYLLEDILRLVTNGVPIMRLGKQTWAVEFLRARVETGDELKTMLGLYPHVRYEPLDFHYACQQSLAALDAPLMDDMVSRCMWAGYVWGALLAGLTGEARYLPYLETRYHHFPRHQWLVDEVRAVLNAHADTRPSPFGKLLTRLRDQLQPLPRLPVQLRLAPSAEAIEKKKAEVRVAYHNGDWDAALALARA